MASSDLPYAYQSANCGIIVWRTVARLGFFNVISVRLEEELFVCVVIVWVLRHTEVAQLKTA